LAVGVVDRGHARARADGVAEVPLVADDRAVAVTRAAAVEVAGEARAAVREACDRRHGCRGAGYGHSLLADPIYARVVGHVETDGVASCGGVGVLGGATAERAVPVTERPLVLPDRAVGIGGGAAVEATGEACAAEAEAGGRRDVCGRDG